MLTAAVLAALMWLGLVCVPWRPWSTRERLIPQPTSVSCDFSDITVLIPARDEASCIADTLRSIASQGTVGALILIDDQSSDGTAEIARALDLPALQIVAGTTPPAGWSGKLWALQQGLERASTRYLLLLDADIELAPGTLAALRARQQSDNLSLVSVMAWLPMTTLWEKLLLPPFIYFFKLIYPFALANDPRSSAAAAAGGCILIEKARLDSMGGFHALRDAIIDDCTLARLVKRGGGRTWLGLSTAVRAIRPYEDLAGIWNMVARTAYTQLRYSVALLLLCTALLGLSFIVPLVAIAVGSAASATCGWIALVAMLLTYLPTIRYYDLNTAWVLTLPLAACLFLAMTWTSAARFWAGERSRWKNRSYERVPTS